VDLAHAEGGGTPTGQHTVVARGAMTASEAPPPRLVALNLVDHPQNGSQLGVIAKRTYRVRGGRCVVDEQQLPLVEVPRVTDDGAALLHDLDIVLNRQRVDVIVTGKARPPRKASAFEVSLRIGPLQRRLSVFGDRRVERDHAGRVLFSAPATVEEIDLGWASAFGGVDAAAIRKHGDPLEGYCRDAKKPFFPAFGRFAYPRNRAGKGYLMEITDDSLESCALPNLEDPSNPLTPESLAIGRPERWPAAPLPASFGWLSYGCFPRTGMLGITTPYDMAACPPATFAEVKLGILDVKSIRPETPLPDRLDLGAAQQSAIGMRAEQLDPGAPVELVNCHPQSPQWRFALAAEKPTMALQLPGERPVTLEPKIRTVLLEPELDRLSVVWVGEHRVPIPVGPGKRALIKFVAQWTR
jgi:hypothetical protein